MKASEPRLLVIDDESAICELLDSQLTRAGFSVRSAPDSRLALALVPQWQPDLVLLDVMMPRIDGISLLPELRRLTEAPILILSAKGGTQDKVAGLERGADYYVVKPFEMPELIAQLRSALRRPRLDTSSTLAYHDLSMDLQTRTVERGGRAIALTSREFNLLEIFIREPRRVFTRDQLIYAIWGEPSVVTRNTVETYISDLRGKIDSDFDVPLLHTVRGVGYALRVPH